MHTLNKPFRLFTHTWATGLPTALSTTQYFFAIYLLAHSFSELFVQFIASWSASGSRARLPLVLFIPAVQFCLQINSYNILWSPWFWLSWDYSLLENWCLAGPSRAIFALLLLHHENTCAITLVRDTVKWNALADAQSADSSVATVCGCNWNGWLLRLRLTLNGGFSLGGQHSVSPAHKHCCR